MRSIDADGHIVERGQNEEIAKYMPRGAHSGPIFPQFDHLHTNFLGATADTGGRRGGTKARGGPNNPDAGDWVEFMDATGIDWTVVYPSTGLGVGRIPSIDWAIAACRAYNNWLYDRFTNVTPRVKGAALIPVQDPHAAAEELHRVVKELGMPAAMLPSTGEGIKGHLGDRIYDPVYEAAEELDCALAVHGGSHSHLGMDSFSTYYPVHALGHPFGIMVQAAAMLSHGVFERFPRLRVGFLEGGATWVPFFLDRMERSYEGHLQVDLEGEWVGGPLPEEGAAGYFCRLAREGRIFVGFDCDDKGLGYATQRAGREPFLFASDFPHEGTTAESCLHEIAELLERDDLTEQDKEAVLATNAERFYGIRG